MNEQSVSIPYELFIDTIYALGRRGNKKVVEQLKAAVVFHDKQEQEHNSVKADISDKAEHSVHYAVDVNDIDHDVGIDFFSFDKKRYTILAQQYKRHSYEYAISSSDDLYAFFFTHITIENYDIEKYKVCFIENVTSKTIIVTRTGLKNLIIRLFGPKNPLFVVDTVDGTKLTAKKVINHLDEDIKVCFGFAETATNALATKSGKENVYPNVPRESYANSTAQQQIISN